MTTHNVHWQAPQPLWSRFGATPDAAATAPDQARPALLRFATDEFMEQMLTTLAREPSRLAALVARPETWRSPAAAQAELIDRTPLPRLSASAMRVARARNPKAPIAATTSVAQVTMQSQPRQIPLKLYQPAHQRFYLAGASLVCATPGFPDHAVVPGASEQVNFVLRRLLPAAPGSTDPANLREFAYVKDEQGATWRRASDGDASTLVAGEELLPVFPLGYQDDGGRSRKLWGGLVPVGRREEYVAGRVDRTAAPTFAQGQRQSLQPAAAPASPSKMARVAQFQMEVAEPWKNLIRGAIKLAAALAEPLTPGAPAEDVNARRKRIFEFNLAQQNTSWLILLDFADYLAAYLPDVAHAIDDNGAGASDLPTEQKKLYDRLVDPVMGASLQSALQYLDPSIPTPPAMPTLRDALKAIRAPGVREGLESTELVYTSNTASLTSTDWPPFHFVLAGVDLTGAAAGPFTHLSAFGPPASTEFAPDPQSTPNMAPQAQGVDRLTALVGRALVATQETDAPPVPFALQMKNALAANIGDAGWFVLRFVYQRRDCGPLHPPVVSAPSQRFQIAGFFDPDAPARPIRIALPLDTSPAGLRKFNKNTAFVLSDMLCGQVQRAKGLGFIDLVRSVLPWPLHKDLDVGSGGSCNDGGSPSISLGMICSISIPIITICALILLIIIVSLLDFVFRWLPYFVICFPVPKLKGKP